MIQGVPNELSSHNNDGSFNPGCLEIEFDITNTFGHFLGAPTHLRIHNPDVNWVEELRGLAQPYLSDAKSVAIDGVGALIHLARELDSDDKFQPKTLRNFLSEIEDRAQQNNPPQMPVTTLATLHAAKGLEWDRVFIVGVGEGYLPYPNTPEEEDPFKYYTQPHEIDAQVFGFKRLSKIAKKPYELVVKNWFNKHRDIHRLNDREMIEVINILLRRG